MDSWHHRLAKAEGVWFILLVATACQLLYSHLGFNPTDEGFMLAGSRRLLDGQVPHRDYIFLRPVGTHILHAHLLLWAGDRLIWSSRFVAWLQFATIAWLWTRIVERCFRPFPSVWHRCAVGFLAFAFCVHIFLITPWNSVDGLFFMSLGIAVRLRAPERWRWAGLVLIGCAPLFRQNFAFPVPLLVLALGDWRSLKSWLLVALPGLLYLLFLVSFGALHDCIEQLTSYQSYLSSALYPPALGRSRDGFLLGILLGGCGGGLTLLGRNLLQQRLGVAVLAGCLVLAIGSLLMASRVHGWFLFGGVLAVTPFLRSSEPPRLRCALLALITAWGVSISLGWPSPALGSGALAVVLLGIINDRIPAIRVSRPVGDIALCTLVIATAIGFHLGRTNRIYYERPASHLRYSLTGVMRGARGIYTNEETYRFLSDLPVAIELARTQGTPGRTLAILPELAQYWATSPQPNPILNDWPLDFEIEHPRLRARVLNDIERGRGNVGFILQKYLADKLAGGLVPFQPGQSIVRDTVRSSFRKIGETEFFEVYE